MRPGFTKPSFGFAMGAYAVMAIVVAAATQGKLRWAILIMLALFAVKTWIARAAGW